MEILRILSAIVLVFLPIVFWGYLFSYAQNTRLSATRFFVGILAWGLSVVPIVHAKEIFGYFSTESVFGYLSTSGISVQFVRSLLLSYWIPVGVLLLVLCAVFFSQMRDRIGLLVRSLGVFLMGGIVFLGLCSLFLWVGQTGNVQVELLGATLASLSSISLAYLFIGALEESAKHLATYPSLGMDAANPRHIALAAVFTSLGFAFLENVYYLIHVAVEQGVVSSEFIGLLASRSIVSLLLHIFATLIFAIGFEKYMNVRNASMYRRFFFAFLLAVCVHALFDISLTYGKTGIIALYAIVGYFFFTKVFFDERTV